MCVFMVFLLMVLPCHAEAFQLQPGDILFQDLDTRLCNAIEKVTRGYNGSNLSHVGIVFFDRDQRPVVYESGTSVICTTPLDSFLSRSFDREGKPKVLVGRLKPGMQSIIPEAFRISESLLGKPFDIVFSLDNDAYYCSELLYCAFLEPVSRKSIFPVSPMSFKDPDTGFTMKIWEDYFSRIGVSIPEGKPGVNPGAISRSEHLDILRPYGTPSGWIDER